MNDVRCDRCDKLLARRNGDKVLITSGAADVVISNADTVMLRCPRCNQITSIAEVLTTV